ncbi:pyridoxamine 5'-phosphate oxidase family protein [Treponema sp. OttesenSCG-928-L16]|nr:pyridoxamine 5'-phosphate oxidase family protein [Treponema sp. OttesenSCG-928-L16]
MRRKDREVTDINEILKIIDACKVCRLGLSDENRPYIVPLNFGYSFEGNELTLYFHSAQSGQKLDILKNNPQLCFEVDDGHALIEGSQACDHGFAYRSVIGFGKAVIITGRDEKVRALNILMKHQTGIERDYEYDDRHLNAVCVYKMICSSFTGKQREVPALKTP